MELSLVTRSVSEHTVLEIGGEIDVYTCLLYTSDAADEL